MSTAETWIVYSEIKQASGSGMVRYVAGTYASEDSAQAAAERLNLSTPKGPHHFDWCAASECHRLGVRS